MTPILRTAAIPVARSALRSASSRHAAQSALLGSATAASTSRLAFSTTSHLANSEPPGKAPQQSPRKNEDQVSKARTNSTALLAATLGLGGLLAAFLYSRQISAEGQQAPPKRLSYAERVKASLNKAAEGTVLESTVASITGEAELDEAAPAADQNSGSSSSPSSATAATATSSSSGVDTIASVVDEDAGEGQEAAYDPSTGQINWDCPCLGGMASGPCGEEFKEAFSCFVFSEQEPKGVECVGKFKSMQDCFRKHPEEYKEELEMEEEDESQSLVYEVEQALGLGEQQSGSKEVAT